MSRRALFVINPAARGLPPLRQIEGAADWLRARGWIVELQATSASGEATRLARDAAARGASVVVACGGDGTIHEVINGLAGSPSALAVIPGGTANVWAKDAHLPRQPLDAVRIVDGGRCRRMDLGLLEWEEQAESRHFLLMAGVGLDAHVVARVSQGWKSRLGAASYILTGARESLLYRSRPVELVIDGRERLNLWLGWLLAGNTRSYGGVVRITGRARADDGLLDILAFPGYDLLRAAGYGLAILAGRHHGAPGVIYRRATEAVIAGPARLPVQADGEFLGYTPVRLRVEPRALRVLLPDEPNPLFGKP